MEQRRVAVLAGTAVDGKDFHKFVSGPDLVSDRYRCNQLQTEGFDGIEHELNGYCRQ